MPIHSRPRRGTRHKDRGQKTKNLGKFVDQIQEELSKKRKVDEIEEEYDEDLAGGGRYPCEACGRHFVDEQTLESHFKSKVHKKRLKILKETPYTVHEAEAAGGLGSIKK